MKMCSVDFWTWLADFKDDAAEEYTTQYETEDEAGERLGQGTPGSWGGNYPSSQATPYIPGFYS